MIKQLSLAVFAGLATKVAATCNPLSTTTCSADTALATATYSHDFTDGKDSDNWSVTAGTIDYTSSGAEFTINEQGDAPTIQSEWYIFFGRVEVHMKAANGTGIVSSIVLLSDDEDEIDWEFLGGEPDNVQSNYFAKGNTTNPIASEREVDIDVDDSQSSSHNYTLVWTEESTIWYVDGTAARTLAYSSTSYPQTPMRIKLGVWAGGDSDNSEGTIEWAGGETDYDDAPFTMTVESIKVTNYNTGSSYTYGDQTGDYDSIVVNDSSSSSSSSTSSSTKTKTKTSTSTGTSTATVAASASASTVSSGTSSNESSSDSTTTPSSSSATTTPSTVTDSLGDKVVPSALIILGAAALAMLGQF